MVSCKKCGKFIPDGSAYCNHCAASQKEPAPQKKSSDASPPNNSKSSIWSYLALALVALIAFGLLKNCYYGLQVTKEFKQAHSRLGLSDHTEPQNAAFILVEGENASVVELKAKGDNVSKIVLYLYERAGSNRAAQAQALEQETAFMKEEFGAKVTCEMVGSNYIRCKVVITDMDRMIRTGGYEIQPLLNSKGNISKKAFGQLLVEGGFISKF